MNIARTTNNGRIRGTDSSRRKKRIVFGVAGITSTFFFAYDFFTTNEIIIWIWTVLHWFFFFRFVSCVRCKRQSDRFYVHCMSETNIVIKCIHAHNQRDLCESTPRETVASRIGLHHYGFYRSVATLGLAADAAAFFCVFNSSCFTLSISRKQQTKSWNVRYASGRKVKRARGAGRDTE